MGKSVHVTVYVQMSKDNLQESLPLTIWILRVKLRLSYLVANVFTH